MAGTREGGLAAAATNKRLQGEDFYAKIGAMGGAKSNNGGFAANVNCNCNVIPGPHYIKNCAGTKGGVKSRRTKRG